MQTPTRVGEMPGRALRIMTYNVHSCRGTDRRHDPARIAEVIAESGPDVIALQELDVGRSRSGRIDQAREIAMHLRVEAHFHPALHVEDEKYGDAILTALPSRLVKAAPLPSVGEPRGAVWVEVEHEGEKIQIINTHLGLRPRERVAQAVELLSANWLGHRDCVAGPAILVGDFNAVPRSPAYRLLSQHLIAPARLGGRKIPATYPSRLPLLRIDHVFTNEWVTVEDIAVNRSPLARRASDHLPLQVSVRFRGPAQSIPGTRDAAAAPSFLEFQ